MKLRRLKIPDSNYFTLTNVLTMKMEGMKKGTRDRKEGGRSENNYGNSKEK